MCVCACVIVCVGVDMTHQDSNHMRMRHVTHIIESWHTDRWM